MFLNSILFQDVIQTAIADPNTVYLTIYMQKVIASIVGFEDFINTITPPLLIISGLTTGVRS